MPTRFSKPSTKPPDLSNATAAPDDRLWRVRLHREVQKVVALHGQDSEIFRPTIGQLIDALKSNPKQFPKKNGPLKDARAADLRFANGIVWRAVFTVYEADRTVKLLLARHDDAYNEAMRRI